MVKSQRKKSLNAVVQRKAVGGSYLLSGNVDYAIQKYVLNVSLLRKMELNMFAMKMTLNRLKQLKKKQDRVLLVVLISLRLKDVIKCGAPSVIQDLVGELVLK